MQNSVKEESFLLNEQPVTSTHPYKILLAEDNIINQKVSAKIFNKLGYDVDIVPNGYEAVCAFTEGHYDIIFMDCQMPEMDGYAATKKIRDIEKSDSPQAHLPIIAMTAYALKGDREKCLQAGMDDYISKPFQVKTLVNILKTYLPSHCELSKDCIETNQTSTQHQTLVPAENTTLLDITRLTDIFGNDKEGISQFLDEFIVSSRALLSNIKMAITNNDLKTARTYLHQLKGSSGNSGAMQMYMLAKQAESDTLNQQLDDLNTHLKAIEDATERLQNELQNLLKSF